MLNDDDFRKIFRDTKVIASVGLSSKPHRPSYEIARFLQEMGYRIIPVNPNEGSVLGEKSYPDLKAVPTKIDLVQVFRKPEFVPLIVDDARDIGAKYVWMQEGAGSVEGIERAKRYGILPVADDCMSMQYRRLYGEEPLVA